MKSKQNPKLEKYFRKVSKHVSKRVPWLKGVKLRYCSLANQDHKKEWRAFAHTFHYSDTICIAKAAQKDLFEDEMMGIFAHEFGHLVADRLGMPGHQSEHMTQAAQREADRISEHVFGLPIQYNRRELEVTWNA